MCLLLTSEYVHLDGALDTIAVSARRIHVYETHSRRGRAWTPRRTRFLTTVGSSLTRGKKATEFSVGESPDSETVMCDAAGALLRRPSVVPEDTALPLPPPSPKERSHSDDDGTGRTDG